jgi:hypothetical protein
VLILGFRWADLYHPLCVLTEFGRTRPTMIVDSGGTAIGLISPPMKNAKLLSDLNRRISRLRALARKHAGSNRGDFIVVEAGLQRGPGSKVCVPSLGHKM